jgi:hypothetical protein
VDEEHNETVFEVTLGLAALIFVARACRLAPNCGRGRANPAPQIVKKRSVTRWLRDVVVATFITRALLAVPMVIRIASSA